LVEAAHLGVETGGEADERECVAGTAGLAEAEAEVEQRLEPELGERALVGGLGGAMPGEQPYGNGQLPPDVAVDLGTDLILIEVRSGYLNRRLRVSGDVDELRHDLDRVVLRKIRQLGNRIADLFAGRASLTDVGIAYVERVWPILVTADITQTESLHDIIEAALPDIYGDRRVQSLLVCDPEGGASLTKILDRRQCGPYSKLELKRSVLEDLQARLANGGRPTRSIAGSGFRQPRAMSCSSRSSGTTRSAEPLLPIRPRAANVART
jgi:hypothetical protein